jgi:prevent-host-death family protein
MGRARAAQRTGARLPAARECTKERPAAAARAIRVIFEPRPRPAAGRAGRPQPLVRERLPRRGPRRAGLRAAQARPEAAGEDKAKPLRTAALAKVKDDFSRYLRLASDGEIAITRHGRPAGVLIGFEDEEAWIDYRLENQPCVSRACRGSPRSASSRQGRSARGSPSLIRQPNGSAPSCRQGPPPWRTGAAMFDARLYRGGSKCGP